MSSFVLHLGHLLLHDQLIFFSFLSLSCFILCLFKWLSTPTNNKNLSPSPPKLPVLGNLHQFGSYPHRSLYSFAQRHGSIMLVHLGTTPALIVSSADAAHEIMKTQDFNFPNRPKSGIGKIIFYNNRDVGLVPYGEYWRQMRSICVHHLLSNKKVQSFRTVREEETALMIEKIKQSCSSCSPINLSEIFVLLANDLVCRVALGRKYSGVEGGKKLKEALVVLGDLLGVFNVRDYIPWLGWVNWVNGFDAKLDKVAKEFDSFLDALLQEHMDDQKRQSSNSYIDQASEPEKDFVDLLLGLSKDITTDFSIAKDMFVGGTDTTYTVLEWAMTELLRHPNVLKEVQNEVQGIVKENQDITGNDLEKMHYLKAVIKEILRLHPPLPLLIPHESIRDVKVMGYDIAARTRVYINAWAIGRDPASWEEPNEFRPERFLDTSIHFKGHDFQFIPFGAGRRGCPGVAFAMTIDELALANLLHKFDWALPGGARGEDLDMTESTAITIYRKYPLLAVATPRSC